MLVRRFEPGQVRASSGLRRYPGSVSSRVVAEAHGDFRQGEPSGAALAIIRESAF